MAGRRTSAKPDAEASAVALARENAGRAIERLVEWIESEDPRISLAACAAILERAFGKPGARAAEEAAPPPVAEVKRVIVTERA